jgi:hypothetical protein
MFTQLRIHLLLRRKKIYGISYVKPSTDDIKTSYFRIGTNSF